MTAGPIAGGQCECTPQRSPGAHADTESPLSRPLSCLRGVLTVLLRVGPTFFPQCSIDDTPLRDAPCSGLNRLGFRRRLRASH